MAASDQAYQRVRELSGRPLPTAVDTWPTYLLEPTAMRTDTGRIVCLVLEQDRGRWRPVTVAAVPPAAT